MTDSPCESTEVIPYEKCDSSLGQLILPTQNYSISRQLHYDTTSQHILTSIKPKDVAYMPPSERAEWELQNVFNHVYTTIQRVMRLWIDPCWRPVIDACFWSTIESSGGDPRVSNTSHRNIVSIGEAYDAISLKFGEPNILLVTCGQWYKYTALTNALSRIQVTIREYEHMRGRMQNPDGYIHIYLTALFPSIDRDRYYVNQPECFDYERVDTPESEYPWPA